MPGPATPVREWNGPPSMMKMHGRMTSKPNTHQSATWYGERMAATENQLVEGWKPQGEVQASDLVTR